MAHMKDLDRRIRQGGDDAIAAVSEYVKEMEGEVASARACAEMMLQGTGQALGEELARRVIDEHYPRRWISVDERLPKEDQRVLVWNWYSVQIAWREHQPNYIIPETIWTFGDDVDKGYPPQGISHWMPLPEPPEVK